MGVPEIFRQQFKDLVMNWIWELRKKRDVKDGSSFLAFVPWGCQSGDEECQKTTSFLKSIKK